MGPLSAPLRGGNTLFLDAAAARAHPYPTVEVGGQEIRRLDMVGATLLARQGVNFFVVPGFDLRHCRMGQAPGLLHDPAEFYGILLARLVMEPTPLTPLDAVRLLATERIMLLRATLRQAAQRVDEARRLLLDEEAWWWQRPEIAPTASALGAVLTDLGPRLEATYIPDVDHSHMQSLVKALDRLKGEAR